METTVTDTIPPVEDATKNDLKTKVATCVSLDVLDQIVKYVNLHPEGVRWQNFVNVLEGSDALIRRAVHQAAQGGLIASKPIERKAGTRGSLPLLYFPISQGAPKDLSEALKEKTTPKIYGKLQGWFIQDVETKVVEVVFSDAGDKHHPSLVIPLAGLKYLQDWCDKMLKKHGVA